MEVLALVCDLKDVLSRIKPESSLGLVFGTSGVGRPRDALLLPFYKVFEKRYTVYRKVSSATDWERRRVGITADAGRQEIGQIGPAILPIGRH